MPTSPDVASAALARLASVLGEDALFVYATGAREPKESLESLVARRGAAYAAAVQAQPHARATGQVDPWIVDMARALAPVGPPLYLPMMDVVREKVTLEIGARGLRSLFSSKPSDKDVARVRRYGTLAVRVLRAVLASDGPLDRDEHTTVGAVVAALGLPEAEATPLAVEAPVAPESLEVYGDLDDAIVVGILRGAWLAAAWDGVDPREERVLEVLCRKLGITDDVREAARKEVLAKVEARHKAGLAAIDAVRYVLCDRMPGHGVQLAALAGMLMIPRRGREEALAPLGQGAPVTLAKRHHGLDSGTRLGVMGVAWAAALADDPSSSRRALLRARWERVGDDLGEDDPSPREDLERWMGEALSGVARTLQ